MLPSLKRSLKFNLKIPSDDITEIFKPSVIGCYLPAKIWNRLNTLHRESPSQRPQYVRSAPRHLDLREKLGVRSPLNDSAPLLQRSVWNFRLIMSFFRSNDFRSSLSWERLIVNCGRISFAWEMRLLFYLFRFACCPIRICRTGTNNVVFDLKIIVRQQMFI